MLYRKIDGMFNFFLLLNYKTGKTHSNPPKLDGFCMEIAEV